MTLIGLCGYISFSIRSISSARAGLALLRLRLLLLLLRIRRIRHQVLQDTLCVRGIDVYAHMLEAVGRAFLVVLHLLNSLLDALDVADGVLYEQAVWSIERDH